MGIGFDSGHRTHLSSSGKTDRRLDNPWEEPTNFRKAKDEDDIVRFGREEG